MPRPRRKLPTNAPFTGNNDRVISPAQAIFAEGLRDWFESIGSNDKLGKILGMSPSNFAKYVVCQVRLPKDAASTWAKPLNLSADEIEALTVAVALSHTPVPALDFLNATWRDAVRQLAAKFSRLAVRRMTPTLTNIPSAKHRYPL